MSILAQVSDALGVAAARAWAAVVLLQRTSRQEREGVGSGAGSHLGAGLVITCAHVAGSDRQPLLVTTHDGRRGDATLLAAAPDDDLALLRVSPRLAAGLPALPMATARPRAGDVVFAVGHPGRSTWAVSTGIVFSTRALEEDRAWIVTDAHLRPGNSGGPLLDAHGHLLGVNAVLMPPDLGVAASVRAVRALLRAAGAYD